MAALPSAWAFCCCCWPCRWCGSSPNAAEYLPYLYLCVLASCLRTLCTQFIRSRMLNRLVAIDGVLTTGALLAYYLVFLSWLKLGAAGFFAGKRLRGPDLDGVCVLCRRVL